MTAMRPLPALALFLLASAALAEPAPDIVLSPDPFRALAEVETRDDIWERSYDSLEQQMIADFRADAALQKGETACPGFIDAIVAAARPTMREGHFRQRETYRAGLERIYWQGMTADEAREAIAFYLSPDGRFALELGTDSTSQQAKIAQGGGPLTRENFDADLERTRAGSRAKIEPEMRRRIEATLARSSWYDPYVALNPAVQDLRFSITRADADGTAENRARMQEAIRRAGIQHFANCGMVVPAPTE